MKPFTLYRSNSKGQASTTRFTVKARVCDTQTLESAIAFDHVSAEYRNHYRKSDNFLQSDVVVLDCDNTHSEKTSDWVTPLEVALAFPEVCFWVSYSRNHNKQKGKQSARPRFHVYFPIEPISDSKTYGNLKKEIQASFPYFDENALDSARLIFGTDNTQVEMYEGNLTIVDFLHQDLFAEWDKGSHQITEGNRNNAMSQLAGKLIKRYGNTESNKAQFLKLAAEKCVPTLPEEELALIWKSAVSFGKKIATSPDYIPPEQYNVECLLKPTDYSDVGQATVLAREYAHKLRYSPSTKFLVYNGSFWEESEPKAQGIEQELTFRQLEEAENEIEKAKKEMLQNGAFDLLVSVVVKKAQGLFNKVQQCSFEKYEEAQQYKKYAIKRRDSRYIVNALNESKPMLEIEQRILDKNEFLLNTPSHTIDLRIGKKQAHDSLDYITKQTEVDPSVNNQALWQDTLNTIFCGDEELIAYVQKIVGLVAIGKVYVEALIISYGEGRNGKSTFWNVISRVLGNYSGSISADILTSQVRRNVKPELAEAKGKRLLIAAELEEGMRLNTSNIKQLCSTDEISAEKKYKDPFKYVPTHTLVLYTNHLPKVGAIDEGTWRRLIVIPFLAKIEGKSEIKNYADYLFEQAGGSVLTWILDGAKEVIAKNYHIDLPKKVLDAMAEYKESNDWVGHFLSECCEVDKTFTEKSGELYAAYRAFCMRSGEYTRSKADFNIGLDGAGMTRKRTKKGAIVYGLRLCSEFDN
ncbi:phage/plasmid primase, P4 family, C-terminal domain-containing protein [Pilibacter termitis]|uniref:Phage/plasmid primase, P4 family, C-terminal domain-containing protein n=1 Tax=Pilibacter termitis TaxID=263852 RepID=A0A1T4PRC7_9ENTE|nr:phage/plasmid primase, P4 family [Pilibacter termitis]SJZ94093.1 phage/plasmid primase, P4 family, C-terminal domain-containing protein [Pilibacter termitis]